MFFNKNFLGVVAKKFHTKFVFDAYTSGSTQLAAFLGGTDQFLIDGGESVIPAIVAHKDLVNINQTDVVGQNMLIGSEKYRESRGSHIADYNGATWCYTTAGSGGQLDEEALAEASGLKWSAQHQVAIGSTSAAAAALVSGRCDLAAVDVSTTASAILRKDAYLVTNMSTLQSSKKLFGGTSPIVGTIFATSRAFMDKYPALTQAIDTALVKAELWEDLNVKDPAKVYAAYPSFYTNVNTKSSFEEQWGLQSPSLIAGSGIFSQEGIDVLLGFMKKNGTFSGSNSQVSRGFTNKYTIKAYSELGLPAPPSSGKPLPLADLQKVKARL